jgi:acyl-coenzyme A thioesterase PaaI-like protein
MWKDRSAGFGFVGYRGAFTQGCAVLAGVLPSIESRGNLIRDAWDRLHAIPGGDALFHLLLRVMVPYTGAMGARVKAVRPGYAEVELAERWAVRNHLRSIHAIALANLVELAGNIAVAYSLPDDARFIVKGIRMSYHKKARGTIVATSTPPVVSSSARQAFEVKVEVRDQRGDLVCEGVLETLVGPKKDG